MIKVREVEEFYFDCLDEAPLTLYEKKVVYSCKRAQSRYKRLSLKRYILFWLIYNKYYELELPIQKEIDKTYGELYDEPEVDHIEITPELEAEYIKKYLGD